MHWSSRFLALYVTLFAFVVAACPPVGADDDPIHHVVRLYHRSIPNGLEVVAENLQGTDVTVLVELSADNVRSDPPLPSQFILEGHESRTVSRVFQADPNRTWRAGYTWHWCYGRTDAAQNPDVVYELPYAHGQRYPIVQGFHGSFSHKGQDEYAIDFGMPEGSPVHASRAGQVVFVCGTYSEGGPQEYFRNRVNTVRIKHEDGTLGEYCHFRFGGITVHEGDQIAAGQLIGYSGHTGFAAGPHLHFLVYRAVDAYHREGYPIVFHVEGQEQPVVLEQGKTYVAP